MLTAVVIYESVLFNRTNHVGRWAESTKRGMVSNSRRFVKSRTGTLAAGIGGSVRRNGPVNITVTVESKAPHTMYVLMGTTGPIMSRRLYRFRGRTGLQFPRGMTDSLNRPNMKKLHSKGYALKLKPGGGHPGRLALSVSGQEANNFFGKGAMATARQHPSLRGWTPASNFSLNRGV